MWLNELMSGLQPTLTPCHPEHTFSLAQRKSMQKESETGWLAKQLCHPEFISGSNHRNIIPLPKNINNIPSTSCTAKRHVKGDYVPQKESKTGGLSKQLCHRNIIPTKENINNITSTSHPAQRKVRGGCATRKAAFTLAEVLITLGVIGVVAALTLPALTAN